MYRILFPRDLWWLNTISKLAEKFRLSATGPYVLHFNQRCYERKLAFYTNTLKLFSDPTSSASKSSTINGYLLQGRYTVPQLHCFFRSSYRLRSKTHLINCESSSSTNYNVCLSVCVCVLKVEIHLLKVHQANQSTVWN